MAKIKTKGVVRIDAYAVISRAVEEGIEYGWNRAHKHTDTPSKDHILTEIDNAVMNSLSEVIQYGENENEDDKESK